MQQPKKTTGSAGRSTEPESRVRVKQQPTGYEQTIEAVLAQMDAGTCDTQEAVDRIIDANVDAVKHKLKPEGQQELARMLRETFATHPRIRKLLGR
jgi:hypothetical protein